MIIVSLPLSEAETDDLGSIRDPMGLPEGRFTKLQCCPLGLWHPGDFVLHSSSHSAFHSLGKLLF